MEISSRMKRLSDSVSPAGCHDIEILIWVGFIWHFSAFLDPFSHMNRATIRFLSQEKTSKTRRNSACIKIIWYTLSKKCCEKGVLRKGVQPVYVRLHRCWLWMLVTKSVADNFEMLVTILAVFVTITVYQLRLSSDITCH